MDSSSSFKRVVQRLVLHGVPKKYLDYQGIIAFAKEDNFRKRSLVSYILPTHEEVAEDNEFQECMTWINWLMFENDPADSLDELPGGRHDTYRSIWCNEDICYKCRTCELDETSSICVSCFKIGTTMAMTTPLLIIVAGFATVGMSLSGNPRDFAQSTNT
ncbi:hypothetical protein ACFE04_021239 [Oxalis oulophora]